MLVDRLLLSAEAGAEISGGGAAPVVTPTETPAAPITAPPVVAPPAGAWHDSVSSLKESNPEIWTTLQNGIKSGAITDLPSLIVKGLSAEKKLGSALNLPNKDKPEERAAFMTKLQEAGIIPVAPASADLYDIKALDSIPESMRSESVVKGFTEWAHKHGLSNDAMGELLTLEANRYSESVGPVIEMDRVQSQKDFDTWAAAKGMDPKAAAAYGGRWLTQNFTEGDMQKLEKAGLADMPVLLKLISQAGKDTGEEISIPPTGGNATDSAFDDTMKMTTDPKHPDYQTWWHSDPANPKRVALQEKYDAAFRLKYGGGAAK